MQKAKFNNIRNEIVILLRQAVNQVNIAMAWFTCQELFEEIINLLNKGVKVNLILLDDAINWQEYAPDFNVFVSKGGNLRIARPSIGFMHHKFCIIDGATVITGSYNWTYFAESRNLENIIISTEANIVSDYTQAFSKLESIISLCDTAPRLTWEQVSNVESVDFDAINFEIKAASEIKHLPVQKIIKNKPVVQITEINRILVARYDIGFMGEDKNGNDEFKPLIKAGTQLPVRNENILYSSDKDSIWCDIRFSNEGSLRYLKKEEISKILDGCISKVGVKFENIISLDCNGYLSVEFVCKANNKKMTVQYIDKELVAYAEE